MGKARDQAGNIWETDAQGNPTRLLQAAQSGAPADPSYQYEAPKAAADTQRAVNQAAASQYDPAAAALDLRLKNVQIQKQLDDLQRTPDAINRDTSKQSFDFAKDLRSQFQALPAYKEYQTVVRQLSSALTTQATPTGDQALITAYAKMLDPGSVVREQEFNTVAAGDSAVGKAIARIEKEGGFDEAGMIRPEVRQRLREEMLNLTRSYNESYNQARVDYRNIAGRYGIDPDEVIGEHLARPYADKVRAWGKQNSDGRDDPSVGLALADPSDDRKTIPIPPPMQAEFQAGLSGVRSADDYAALRDTLDQKYGFGPAGPDKAAEYRNEWPNVQEAIAGGKTNLAIPPVDAAMTGRDQINNTIFNNPVGAAAMSAPVFAPVMDEVAGGIRSVMNGTDYGVERDVANATRQYVQNEYPLSSLGGAVGGGLLSGGVFAKAAPKLADITSRTFGRTAAAGAGLGAVGGAAEYNDDRATGALYGAGAGVAGAALGRAVAPAMDKITATRPFQRLAELGNAGMNMARSEPVPFQPAAVLSRTDKAVGAIPLDDIRQNVTDAQSLGLPYTLADAAPQTRALAGAATRFSPKVRGLADDTLTSRQDERSERAMRAVRGLLGEPVDTAQRRQDLFRAGSTAASPAYEETFARAAPISDEVDAILRTRTGKDALRAAYGIAENEGFDPLKIGFELDDLGDVTLVRKPSFRALDLVKRGIDAQVETRRNPVTGNLDLQGDPVAQGLDTVRKRLIGSLDRIEPKYAEARSEFAKYAKQADALDMGYNAPARNVLPRDMQRGMTGLDDDALAQYRTGYATRVSDDIAKSERGDPFEGFYGKPGSTTSQRRAKVGMLFPDTAPKLDRMAALERDMANTYQEVLGGSQTQPRRIADEQFANRGGEIATNAVIDATTTGAPVLSGMAAARKILGDMAERGKLGALGSAGAERKAEEIGPALLGQDANSVQEYLDELERRQRAVSLRQGQYNRMGGLFGSSVGTNVGAVTAY